MQNMVSLRDQCLFLFAVLLMIFTENCFIFNTAFVHNMTVTDSWACLLSRSFIEDSQASIKISPQDNNYLGLTDRLVTLMGSLEEQMRAIELILSKLTEDPHYTQFMNAPFSYAGVISLVS